MLPIITYHFIVELCNGQSNETSSRCRWPSWPLSLQTRKALPREPCLRNSSNFSPVFTLNSHSWYPSLCIAPRRFLFLIFQMVLVLICASFCHCLYWPDILVYCRPTVVKDRFPAFPLVIWCVVCLCPHPFVGNVKPHYLPKSHSYKVTCILDWLFSKLLSQLPKKRSR